MKEGWKRYRVQEKCPVCLHGGKMGHCSGCCYAGPLESPLAVLCLRVQEGSLKEAQGGMGWVHRLRDDENRPRMAPQKPKQKPIASPGLSAMALRAESEISEIRVSYLAETLGVSEDSLRRLRVGWIDEYLDEPTGEVIPVNGWSFPMVGDGKSVIGIRTRGLNGSKRSIRGSINGIFVARGLEPTGPLVVVEGPTECAAFMDWGFSVIGRPSNTAGLDYIVAYVKRFLPRRPVIIARNADAAGSDAERLTLMGVHTLSEALVKQKACCDVSVIYPPHTKDFRDMKIEGSTRSDIEELIEKSFSVI